MRLLNATGSLLAVAVAVLAVAVGPTGSAAHPANETDHGVNASTYHTLWSGDADDGNLTVRINATDSSAEAMRTLAAGTDVPLDSPPRAVERWNRGELEEFPETDADTSVHPPDATLTDGRFVKDAYAEVFAVQPATRARLSPEQQPLYVAPNGTLLGTVDYRVTAANESDDVTITDHRIVETRLLVDGEVVSRANGTHTPALAYALDGPGGQSYTLTLEAEIAVELDEPSNGTAGNTSGPPAVETVTVSDSIEVEVYDLSVSGHRATYPNGDLGLLVQKNQPWLGYSLPGGDVRGVWRFYSARDDDWDTLVTSTEDGNTRSHSPLHPLQVNAYPIETGPTPTPRGTVTILDVIGHPIQPPSLPTNVQLDVLEQRYTASYGIATRTATPDEDLEPVTAYGLVRGVTANVSEDELSEVPIHETNLTLTVRNRTGESVTVRATLRDAETGVPIQTRGRGGYIVLQGERVETDANGTVTRTLARPSAGISARFEPGQWWRHETGYVGDSDVVYVRGTVLHGLRILYELAVPVGLFLLGVFVIDRFTGWGVWPPWRGLE